MRCCRKKEFARISLLEIEREKSEIGDLGTGKRERRNRGGEEKILRAKMAGCDGKIEKMTRKKIDHRGHREIAPIVRTMENGG
jgi:hypothetical protein